MLRKTYAVAVMLLVPLIVTAGASPNGPPTVHTPVGIRCHALGVGSVICTAQPPGLSAKLIVGHHGHATLSPISISKRGALVQEGDAWGGTENGYRFQCSAETAEVICTDFGAHGFTLDQHAVTSW